MVNDPYVNESPISWVEGDSSPVDLTIPGSPTLTGTPGVKLYNGSTDTGTSNVAATGSASVAL